MVIIKTNYRGSHQKNRINSAGKVILAGWWRLQLTLIITQNWRAHLMHKFLSLLYRKHVSHCLHNFRQLWKINTRSIKRDLETWRSSLRPAVLTKPFPSLSKTLNASLISSSISESLNSLGKDIAEAYFFCLTWSSARRIRWSWCRHRRLDQWQRPFPGSSWELGIDLCIIFPKYLSRVNQLPHEP